MTLIFVWFRRLTISLRTLSLVIESRWIVTSDSGCQYKKLSMQVFSTPAYFGSLTIKKWSENLSRLLFLGLKYFHLKLLIFLSVSLYTIYNLLIKLEYLDEFIEKQEKNDTMLLETLRRIDSRQMFEKDDDVGTLFMQIKQTIEHFKQIK